MRVSPRVGWLPSLWFFVFFLAPLLILLAMSFATRGVYGGVEWSFSFENYRRLFDPLYALIFFRSLGLAALTTALCLILALPLAWAVATLPTGWRFPALVVLALPFLVNMISRIYAIRGMIGFGGPLEVFGQWVERGDLTWIVVLYGMISSYFIFLFFPVYVAFEKFDYLQVEAAQDLGARSWTIFARVFWPQLRRSVIAGSMMVFVPALGEFVIPDLLGGAKTMLAGNLVSEQFLKTRDWPFGSALAVVMVVIMFVCLTLFGQWREET